MEEQILLWIHEQQHPWLDLLFRLSHEFGTGRFCTALVLSCAAWWLWRKRPREAVLWVVLGLSVFLLQLGLKEAFGRVRPALWVGPIKHSTYAFPSGHALAAACLYPLLAHAASLRFPGYKRLGYGLAIAFASYVGLGRLYLGVHWPTDVLAGWSIGAVLLWLGVRFIARPASTLQPDVALLQPDVAPLQPDAAPLQPDGSLAAATPESDRGEAPHGGSDNPT